MPTRDAERQHPPQQLGCGPVPGDRTRLVVLVVDLGPTRRWLPRLEAKRIALAAVGRKLGDVSSQGRSLGVALEFAKLARAIALVRARSMASSNAALSVGVNFSRVPPSAVPSRGPPPKSSVRSS